jgi:serine acetyltransferase
MEKEAPEGQSQSWSGSERTTSPAGTAENQTCPKRDRVWIGANAIIVGGITIGEGAMIAPGAFVNFDVAPNSVVLGNPGRVVSNKGSVLYIHNAVERDGSIPPRVL